MNYYAHEKISRYRSDDLARAAERRRRLNLAQPRPSAEPLTLKQRWMKLVGIFSGGRELVGQPNPAPAVNLDPVWTSAETSPYDELEGINEPAAVS